MSAFKAYDIRGIYGKEIDPPLAYRVGRAFGRFLGGRHTAGGAAGTGRTYMVGHDARLHSPELYREVIRGLVEEGKRVTGIGLTSTPLLHYSQFHGGCDGAVMVTASHNPPPYHGFKLFDDKGGSVSYAKGLDRIEGMVAAMAGAGGEPAAVPGGSASTADPLEAYIEYAASPARSLSKTFRVVIDVGNGSAGRVFRRFAERLALEAVLLNEEPDGRFPNRDPNPLKPESRRGCAERVRASGADLGVILDGDGDRLLCVDERGEPIENYFLAALIAEELLAQHPGSAVVYDLICSRALPERIRALGGRPEVTKVGYANAYDRMVESKAVFGAEASGHVYFRVDDTSFYAESAAYALAVLLTFLERKGQPLSALIAPLKDRYVQSPEINIEMPDRGKVEEALRRVLERYAWAKIDRLDGVSVETPKFWFNIRPSNTEPLLRLRLEGVDRPTVEAGTRELLGLLEDLHR